MHCARIRAVRFITIFFCSHRIAATIRLQLNDSSLFGHAMNWKLNGERGGARLLLVLLSRNIHGIENVYIHRAVADSDYSMRQCY